MMEVSKKQHIIAVWLVWHFLEAPGFLVSTWKNYLVFTLEFFSIPFLLATLFSPWRQYRWNYPKGFDVGGYAGNFIFNTFSRAVGFLCRLALIVLGIITELLVFTAGIFMILFWIFMPGFLLLLIFILAYV